VTTAKIVVTVLGFLAIAWVNYWFFFSKRGGNSEK
jgi:plastocyanin domain-containing protein